MRLGDRMSRLGTETAFEVLAKAKRLEADEKDIIRLEIGEPGFDTAENIVDAGIKALNQGCAHHEPCTTPAPPRKATREEIRRTAGRPVKEGQAVFLGWESGMSLHTTASEDENEEARYPSRGLPIKESANFIKGQEQLAPPRGEKGFAGAPDESKHLPDHGLVTSFQVGLVGLQPIFNQGFEGAHALDFQLLVGGATVLTLALGVLKYLKSKRRRHVNINTFLQILHQTKRVKELIQESQVRKHKKALEEMVEIIHNLLLKLLADTYGVKESEITQWMRDGKITPDELTKLLKTVVL